MSAINPFPFQEEGAQWLQDRRRALLFDAPGLGKTIQAIKAADYAGMNDLTVVCPASVRTQWVAAMRDNGRMKTQQAYSYNHARDVSLPHTMGALALDEAHFLKSRNSGRTLAMYGEQPYGVDGHIIRAERVWLLSGTPAPKDASDLYPLMLAVVPGSLTTGRGIMDYWTYMRRYCDYYNGPYGIVVKGNKNMEELSERLAPYMKRRLKKDVMKDWKKPLVADVTVDIGKALKGLKEQEQLSEGAAIARVLKADGIEGLKHLSDQSATLRRYTGLLLIGPMVSWLADQISGGEKKIVAVAHHREVIEGIQSGLKERSIKSVMYRGGMSEAQKDAVKKQFMEDDSVSVFIGQIIAAGTGLDGLQRVASRIVLIEFSWIPDENQQAIDRLDRIGQTEPVLAEFVGIEGSLHGQIATRMRQRAADNETLFG